MDEVASYPIINYCDGGCGVGCDGRVIIDNKGPYGNSAISNYTKFFL